MLRESLIPTRIILQAEREKVVVVEPQKPSRFRSFYVIKLFAQLLANLFWMRLTGSFTQTDAASRFRNLLEGLGGLWIKVGQLLSLRIDIFSLEFCRELSKLQDQAHGFPSSTAKQIIESELGVSIEEYFDEFDDEPFAAASVGQIHRAHLRHEGVWVAIKVQRPYLSYTLFRDLRLIQRFVRLFEMFSILPFMRWREALLELRQIMDEELDYRFEAAGMRRLKKTLRKHKIYVPKIFTRYITRRVLVMEFIHAALMADYIKMLGNDPVRLAKWLEENNIDPQLVARRLNHSLLRQLFEDNLYHGDLHPGNIILLRNSRIAFIDFGSIGFTDREYLEKLRLFMKALATRDYSKAADLTFLLSLSLPAMDVDQVKNDLMRHLRAWGARTHVSQLSYQDKSIDNAAIGLTKIMFKNRCSMDWSFLRVRRAMATLDAAIMALFPNVDYTRLIEQYFQQAEQRILIKSFGPAIIPRLMTTGLTTMEALDRLYEYVFHRGAMIRRQAQVFEGTTSKFAYFFAVLFRLTMLFQLVLGVVFVFIFLSQHHTTTLALLVGDRYSRLFRSVPRLDYEIWIALIIVVFYLCRTCARLQRRFADQDLRPSESNGNV